MTVVLRDFVRGSQLPLTDTQAGQAKSKNPNIWIVIACNFTKEMRKNKRIVKNAQLTARLLQAPENLLAMAFF